MEDKHILSKYHKYKTKYLQLRNMCDKTIKKAIVKGKSYVGIPYGKWRGGPLSEKAPMWSSNKPVTCEVKSASCAGLTNLMLRSINVPLPYSKRGGTGGTLAYYDYYKDVAEDFDINKKYPEGTLIGRKYYNIEDQGHVAVVLKNGKLLQSYPNAGVTDNITIAQSHMGHYYEYAVLPQNWLCSKSKL